MARRVRKAAVLGSGTMGGGIATLLAGVGIPTILLDIAAPETLPSDTPAQRNAIAHANLKRLQKARPPQLFSEGVLRAITVGNLEDDLNLLTEADLVIEVVVEDLAIKHQVLSAILPHLREDAILTTNTSGLPIRDIAEILPADVARRFLGTHFFNPPRYLHLLEVIPHSGTDAEVTEAIVAFGRDVLGKGVVLCKDQPNFIGNRFMTIAGSHGINLMLDQGLTIEEVDALTGPLIGRPKTASFHLRDLVGYDVSVFVSRNLYPAIPDDPAREVLVHPRARAIAEQMMERRLFGRKTGRGFYHMRRVNGGREFWALNLETMEYEPPKEVSFESVEKHRKVRPVGERIRRLLDEDDRAGQYLWHMHAFYLAYASQRVPGITDTIVNVDNAIKWGFGHELGPFEIWDALGARETVSAFEAAGYPVADWVKQLLAAGHEHLYRYDEHRRPDAYYCVYAGEYLPILRDENALNIVELRAKSSPLAQNDSASIHDMGERVLLLEFHSKQNSIDPAIIEQAWRALDLLDGESFDALVIGNQGSRFSVGFNILLGVMLMNAGRLAELEAGVANAQHLAETMRYFHKPIVTAPFQHTFGAGAELMMAGGATVAAMELYAGLVEFGVGLIPAGGGCVSLLRRILNPVMGTPNGDPMPQLQRIFETIAFAKVSGSALEARELGFLADDDRIVTNPAHLLQTAKARALSLRAGYQPPRRREVWACGRDAHAALLIGIDNIRRNGNASEYDAHIARKLAYVLCGGDLARPGWVSADYLYALEREAFMSLMGEEKTHARIIHMLETNKPLRN